MKQLLLLVTILCSGVLAQADTIADYHYYERDAAHWHAQYMRAPSGSWEEQHAKRQRNNAIEIAIDVVNRHGAFDHYQARTIEDFAREEHNKYMRDSTGSAMERLHKEARNSALDGLLSAIEYELRYLRHFERAVSISENFHQKYMREPSGSRFEAAYKSARNFSADTATSVFQSQARYMSYRELYQIQERYHQKYLSAPSGSRMESLYRSIRNIARDMLR